MKLETISKEEQAKILKKAGISAAPEQTEVSFEEIDSFGDQASLMKMVRSVADYNKMLGQKITLINDSLTAAIPFTRENLYLFCAYTGSGKSTVAANISYPLWKQGKKVLVVSNEESEQDVLFRIACLETGYSFNEYKKGMMPQAMQLNCLKLFPEISKFVKVIDVNWREGLTTKIEGVKGALESIKGKEYSCVLIDYYQLIKDSLRDRDRTRYDVLNDLRVWLGQYIKGCEIPVCLFVQLYSMGKRPSKELDNRIKECSAILEPATVVIEVVPNFEEQSTSFIVHKDRFGVAGLRIECPFEHGRFLKQLSAQDSALRIANIKKKNGEKQLENLITDLKND